MIFRATIIALVAAGFSLRCIGEDEVDVSPSIRIIAKGVQLTLLAEHPSVVTPTGIDVDEEGNVWVVTSHTHFRPEDYEGPEHDEVVILAADGTRSVFYSQTDATMDLELGLDGWVYLSERDRIVRVRDTDGDGVGDEQQDVAILRTEAEYPHNGLSGLAWHPSGDLLFALGENFWKTWTLTSADGTVLTGTGEGGIFRCRPDGTSLHRVAKGFWNPFGICVRQDGTMFVAENDPGARPPCRLLHVVEGGEYGYQRSYGSAPMHPFVCWNGELRGTLPMLHSLGEAPCGIAPLGNGLLVPSWTDHRIDFYPLQAKGASFRTTRVELVEGGRQFRPTCIVQASPTVFYLADWVFGSYKLHGFGRVWKLEIDPALAGWLGPMEVPPPTAEALTAEKLRRGDDSIDDSAVFQMARSTDPFLSRAAIDALARRSGKFTIDQASGLSLDDRISLLLAMRKSEPANESWIRHFWSDSDPQIQFETLRWIADERLGVFRKDVERKLADPGLSYQLFEASLAAWNTLSGNPDQGIADPEMLMKRVLNENASLQTRAFALRLVRPDDRKLTPEIWDRLLASEDELLTRELTRTLVSNGSRAAAERLLRIALDENVSLPTRADAIAGISVSDATDGATTKLLEFASSPVRVLREEALRSLRFVELQGEQRRQLSELASRFEESADLANAAMDPDTVKQDRPAVDDTKAWRARLDALPGLADVESGRRVFHHAKVGLCSNCHRHDGRGNVVGPDLSAASTEGDPDRLLRALLEPSRDVDPQYYPWSILTDDGHAFTGIMLRDGGGGSEVFRDNQGREKKFSTADIVARKPLKTSMMPDGLVDLMTDREIRDVLAFLDSSESSSVAKPTARSAGGRQFLGQWWLEFPDGYGGWLNVSRNGTGLRAELLWRVGSPKAVSSVELRNGRLHLQRGQGKKSSRYVAHLVGDLITVTRVMNQPTESDVATGKRCPPMPSRPDLTKILFGKPIDLFNGRNLDGWKLQPAEANNGWSVRDGVLTNETPKTDFSGYGDFGNLRTEREFGDFQLHIEFNVGSKRNSGIYLRGLYEVQVVDSDSPMQGIHGPGAVFGRIAPTQNAGRPGGEWQTYDLTLVDRHISVNLNSLRVIDNQPVEGCTGGALIGNVTAQGPIYLQGDHTSVRYRNIRLSPRIPDPPLP